MVSSTIPDSPNLGGRHIQAMMDIWRRDQLAPPTVQTYLSFLRGLVGWIGKPGMVQSPGAYGWTGPITSARASRSAPRPGRARASTSTR